MFTVFDLGKFKIGVCQGVHKPYFEPFLPIFWDFLFFLQFFTLELCNIWLTISLEYPSAYVYSFCFGNFQNKGLLGGIKGSVFPTFSHFCLFYAIFCLFLTFFTLESCYVWLTFIFEYPSAYIYSCCPGKIQNSGPSGGP